MSEEQSKYDAPKEEIVYTIEFYGENDKELTYWMLDSWEEARTFYETLLKACTGNKVKVDFYSDVYISNAMVPERRSHLASHQLGDEDNDPNDLLHEFQ
jgi:hypothetical protein